jgi:hypothetical protein
LDARLLARGSGCLAPGLSRFRRWHTVGGRQKSPEPVQALRLHRETGMHKRVAILYTPCIQSTTTFRQSSLSV